MATHCEPVGLVQVAETVAVFLYLQIQEDIDGGEPRRTDRGPPPSTEKTQSRRCSNRIGTYLGAISGSIFGMTLSTTSGNRSGN